MAKYPGSLLPELQAVEMKMRDPSVHASPYIQPTCFIARCPLAPVTASQLLELFELLFPFASLSLYCPTLHSFGAALLFSGLMQNPSSATKSCCTAVGPDRLPVFLVLSHVSHFI